MMETIDSTIIETYEDLVATFDAHWGVYVYDVECVFTSNYSITTYQGFQTVAAGEGYNHNYSYEVERLAKLIYKHRE